MSEFFSQLGANIRFPDANINGGGPLPTSLSGPAGVNGDPDGRINFNSELLSGIAPYAYGPGQGRMGADRNYQQIPHRIQKIVPKIFLPYADVSNVESSLAISHAVDQGDIAFILQSSRVQSLIYDNMAMRDASIANLQIPSHTVFINISTVNYLLAGLQRLTAETPQSAPWAMLARDLGYQYKRKHRRVDLLQLVSTRMIPFGICAGSENQGGKHETGLAPVQAAANHVTTLTVDGQNRDLVNIWRNIDISAGDNLILKLQWLPTQSYTLNHYYKGVVRQTFVRAQHSWQLIPDVFKMGFAPAPPSNAPWSYDYRVNGYWRIGQCFQHRASCEADPCNVCDDTHFLRGQLLQVTFAPVWTQFQPLNHMDADELMLPVVSAPDVRAASLRAAGAKRTFQDAFRDQPDSNCLLQIVPTSGPACLLKKWNLVSGNVLPVNSALSLTPFNLGITLAVPSLVPATATTIASTERSEPARQDKAVVVASRSPAQEALLPRAAATAPIDEALRPARNPPQPGMLAAREAPQPAMAPERGPPPQTERGPPAQAERGPPAQAQREQPAQAQRGPPPQDNVSAEPATVARLPIALPAVRPVASLSSLGSEMRQMTTESTSSVAGAGDRTIKRVLNKGGRRPTTSD